ncbi:MAG: hypothetical protein FJZ01_03735 [Candidatus Sericytochromatia bacterium]|nr:hypothetical protein [Candidatus Tanganyikabacteria bacterium]
MADKTSKPAAKTAKPKKERAPRKTAQATAARTHVIAEEPATVPGTPVVADVVATAESQETAAAPPVAERAAIVFESGMRPTILGNGFEIAVTAGGDAILRYEDRNRFLGARILAVMVAEGRTVAVAELDHVGAIHEGRIKMTGDLRQVQLAFTGNGRWDSNNGRNYQVALTA